MGKHKVKRKHPERYAQNARSNPKRWAWNRPPGTVLGTANASPKASDASPEVKKHPHNVIVGFQGLTETGT
jgi:hypothetical protein